MPSSLLYVSPGPLPVLHSIRSAVLPSLVCSHCGPAATGGVVDVTVGLFGGVGFGVPVGAGASAESDTTGLRRWLDEWGRFKGDRSAATTLVVS